MKKLQALALLALATVAGSAMAGTGGTEFAAAVTQITGWLEGGLGQLLAIGALAVGLGIGVVKQSIMAVCVGIAMSLACAFGPGVMTGVFTAALPIL